MNDPRTHQVIQLDLDVDQKATVRRDGWQVEFNEAGKEPKITHNGKIFNLAPAIILHRLNDTDIGQMIETDNVQKGILLAPAFQHVNRHGKRIGPLFDYFAAPQDTRFYDGSGESKGYLDDIVRIAHFKNVLGHDGLFDSHVDQKICYLVENFPRKLAYWHMPSLPLVGNIDPYDRPLNPNNMYAHKDRGSFKDTFTDAASPENTHLYWTSTRQPGFTDQVVHFDFTGHGDHYDDNQEKRFSSRPVRAEIRRDI